MLLIAASVIAYRALTDLNQSKAEKLTEVSDTSSLTNNSLPWQIEAETVYERIAKSSNTWVDVSAPLSLPANGFSWFRARRQRYVDELTANGQKTVTDSSIPYITNLPLTRLSLNRTGITRASIEPISTISSLEILHLDGVKLKPQDIRMLTKLIYLRELTLNNCGLNDDCLKELGKFKMITHLQVYENQDITSEGVEYLSQLPLLSLGLAGTNIHDDIGPELAKMRGLTQLIISATAIGDKVLLSLQTLPNLRLLALKIPT